jgi:putative transposase
MTNHVHLLALPEREDSLARTLGRTHSEYARYWNASQSRCGHLWQARYFSCALESDQVWNVARYVEVNPVRAGMVQEAERWPWSSAKAHITGQDGSGLLDLTFWAEEYGGPRWLTVLRTSIDEEAWQQRLREATLRGRPLGSEAFINGLESRLGCRLRPNPPGRPPKRKEVATEPPHQMSLAIGI